MFPDRLLDRSAPLATSRGTMTDAGSSSALMIRVLPSGALPSPCGHSPPREMGVAMALVIVDLSVPPSPPRRVIIPCGKRFLHSHVIGCGSMSAALVEII